MLAYGNDPSLPSVPRSKGCLNCVARKTRCDGRRPTCRACETRKQVCGGYRRDKVVFLNEGWRALGVTSEARRANRTVLPTSTLKPSADEGDKPNPLALCVNPAMDRSQLHIAYFLASFGTRPGQALGSLIHLFRYYLPNVSSTGFPRPHDPSSWSPTTPVVFAVDALAYCHFGTANADCVAVQRSFQMYGLAVQSMSLRLREMIRTGSNFDNISDEDWQHSAFFCLVMAFWEMKMSPATRNWENHLRCLAAAILLRGTDYPYSKTNSQLLASSRLLLMLQTLSAGEPNDWQQRSPIRSAWLSEVKLALRQIQDPNLSTDYELYRSIDALMADVTSVVSIKSQFDQQVSQRPAIAGLKLLYDQIESTLSQNEARLARWKRNVSEISLASWLLLHQDMATDSISGGFWTSMNEPDIRPCFNTVFNFRTMLEYHSITLYWTIIMSLRLLLRDMLTFMIRIDIDGMSASLQQKIEDHRIQLMNAALSVLRTICYATCTENRAAGPFVFATAFQLTIVVLERERSFLQAAAAGSSRDSIQRCDKLKSLAVRYLDWAMQNKIPVKMELDAFRKWGISFQGIRWDEIQP